MDNDKPLTEILFGTENDRLMENIQRQFHHLVLVILARDLLERAAEREGTPVSEQVDWLMATFDKYWKKLLGKELAAYANSVEGNDGFSLGKLLGMPDSEGLRLKYEKALKEFSGNMREALNHQKEE